MQLSALETRIRISRKLKKIDDLMLNHRSGAERFSCSLQAQASGPKISELVNVGVNGSACRLQDTVTGFQDFWRQLSATLRVGISSPG